MSSPDFYAIPDGQTLLILANGIEIVRRRKHEPIRLEGLTRERLVLLTGKKNGSKFLPSLTLEHIIIYTQEILIEQHAVLNISRIYTKTFENDIGIAGGVYVKTMQVLFDGRYAHAYPVALST